MVGSLTNPSGQMSFAFCRYTYISSIVLIFFIFPTDGTPYTWPFKAIHVEVKLKDKAEPYFASYTWMPPQVEDKCDERLLNSTLLHELPQKLKDRCMTKKKNVVEMSVDPDTLYEYVLTVNPESKDDQPEILFVPKQAERDPRPTQQITHYLTESYTLRSSSTETLSDPQQRFCRDELNRDYTPVKLVNKCVFMQIEQAVDANVSKPVKMLPTDPRQITQHLERYRQPRHRHLSQALDFLFQKTNKDEKSKLPDDGCVNLMRLDQVLKTRIIICRFNPSDVEKYQNLNKEVYFCGRFSLTSSYILFFNKDKKLPIVTKEFYNLIENRDVEFTEMCYSEVTVEPDASSTNKDFVYMNVFVQTLPTGNTNHQVLNVSQGVPAASAALREKIEERCPYEPLLSPKPHSFTFHMASPSDKYFIQFAHGSFVLSQVRLFKPCYFQYDIGEENSFKHCIRYFPLGLRKKSQNMTGGFQQSTELVISREKNACRVSLVQDHEKCTSNQHHLALICECYTQYCDAPDSVSRRQMISSVSKKVCAVRVAQSNDDNYDTKSSRLYTACYYQITLLDGQPQFILDAYDIEKAKTYGLPFQNCVNSTVPDRQRCITKDSTQICCCKAGTDSIPCNSVEVARNRHATSKLRTSARCSTYLHLAGDDKAACDALSSKMRICVSVYDVIKNEDQTELHLARETCESEHLYSPYDLALIKCHAYRKTIIEEQSGECATILVEEYRNMTATEAAQKVISCCPPEAYTTSRDSLKEFKFKPISEFI